MLHSRWYVSGHIHQSKRLMTKLSGRPPATTEATLFHGPLERVVSGHSCEIHFSNSVEVRFPTWTTAPRLKNLLPKM